jgi:hypothetical protein
LGLGSSQNLHQQEKIMGLYVSVYRDARDDYDCTLGGISSQATQLCLINVSGPSQNSIDAPAAILESHVKGCLRIVPAELDEHGNWVPKKGWYMMGGNYAATSDSRFSEACEALLGHRFYGAVAVHDRNEG